MSEYLRLARPYFLLLALFTVGRWTLGVYGVPYEKGNPVFTIMVMTMVSALYYGAFCRRWRGYGPWQVAQLCFLMGLVCQVVIFLATALSYGLGLHTYFNHYIALNVDEPVLVPVRQALITRFWGVVGNPFSIAILGALGWAFGGLLPRSPSS
jgi:hypothetical protein